MDFLDPRDSRDLTDCRESEATIVCPGRQECRDLRVTLEPKVRNFQKFMDFINFQEMLVIPDSRAQRASLDTRDNLVCQDYPAQRVTQDYPVNPDQRDCPVGMDQRDLR